MNVSQYRKAVAAVVVPVVVFLAAKVGFDVPDGWAEALTAVITGAVVYAVPNRGAA